MPLVIAIGRDQTAPALDRILERRLFQQGFRPRIDHQRELAGVLDPGWQQPPTHQPKMPDAVFNDDHGHRLSGRHVKPRREIRLFRIAKYLPQGLWGRSNYESSAHSEGQIGVRSAPFNLNQ
jgi:hypothetical protein